MTTEAWNETIAAVFANFRLLLDHVDDAWQVWVPHGFAAVTGAPIPALNGVVASSSELDPQLAADLLERARGYGVPYSLVWPDRGAGPLADVARAHGLVRDDDLPLFRLDRLAEPAPTEGVEVRELAADEVGRNAELAATVFGAPPEVFAVLLTPAYVAVPGVRYYLATLDGEPVGTGLGVTTAGATAVHNIATTESGRGRGVGAAVTHRIVSDGRADGARFAWLQSTPLAVPLYERLGFAQVDSWQVWVSASPTS